MAAAETGKTMTRVAKAEDVTKVVERGKENEATFEAAPATANLAETVLTTDHTSCPSGQTLPPLSGASIRRRTRTCRVPVPSLNTLASPWQGQGHAHSGSVRDGQWAEEKEDEGGGGARGANPTDAFLRRTQSARYILHSPPPLSPPHTHRHPPFHSHPHPDHAPSQPQPHHPHRHRHVHPSQTRTSVVVRDPQEARKTVVEDPRMAELVQIHTATGKAQREQQQQQHRGQEERRDEEQEQEQERVAKKTAVNGKCALAAALDNQTEGVRLPTPDLGAGANTVAPDGLSLPPTAATTTTTITAAEPVPNSDQAPDPLRLRRTSSLPDLQAAIKDYLDNEPHPGTPPPHHHHASPAPDDPPFFDALPVCDLPPFQIPTTNVPGRDVVAGAGGVAVSVPPRASSIVMRGGRGRGGGIPEQSATPTRTTDHVTTADPLETSPPGLRHARDARPKLVHETEVPEQRQHSPDQQSLLSPTTSPALTWAGSPSVAPSTDLDTASAHSTVATTVVPTSSISTKPATPHAAPEKKKSGWGFFSRSSKSHQGEGKLKGSRKKNKSTTALSDMSGTFVPPALATPVVGDDPTLPLRPPTTSIPSVPAVDTHPELPDDMDVSDTASIKSTSSSTTKKKSGFPFAFWSKKKSNAVHQSARTHHHPSHQKQEKHGKKNKAHDTTHLSSPSQDLPGPKYSNYRRYPLHVERGICRLSHLKLANASTPLVHQVLISNMLVWYMSLRQAEDEAANDPESGPNLQTHHGSPGRSGGSKRDKDSANGRRSMVVWRGGRFRPNIEGGGKKKLKRKKRQQQQQRVPEMVGTEPASISATVTNGGGTVLEKGTALVVATPEGGAQPRIPLEVVDEEAALVEHVTEESWVRSRSQILHPGAARPHPRRQSQLHQPILDEASTEARNILRLHLADDEDDDVPLGLVYQKRSGVSPTDGDDTTITGGE